MPINLRHIFIQNMVFSCSILLSFIDVLKVGYQINPDGFEFFYYAT